MNFNEFKAERQAQGAWTVDGKRTTEYIKALVFQTKAWIDGTSLHNALTNECCPDFSCCHPDMQANQVIRWTQGEKALEEFLEGRCHRCFTQTKDGLCQNYGCEGEYNGSRSI